MSFVNHRWIGLDGTADGGKTPTGVVIIGNVAPSPAQFSAAERVYSRFCDRVANSALAFGYHTHTQALADGSMIWITAIGGKHKVVIAPAPTTSVLSFLPHGFLVQSDLASPFIYGKGISTNGAWTLKPFTVLQSGAITAHNQMTSVDAGGDYVFTPLVLKGGTGLLWTYKQLQVPPNTTALPAMIRIGSSSEYATVTLRDGQIFGSDATTPKYVMTSPNTVAVGQDARSVQYLSPNTSGDGAYTILTAWQSSTLTAGGPTYYNVVTEVVKYDNDQRVQFEDQSITSFVTPAFVAPIVSGTSGKGPTTGAEDACKMSLVIGFNNIYQPISLGYLATSGGWSTVFFMVGNFFIYNLSVISWKPGLNPTNNTIVTTVRVDPGPPVRADRIAALPTANGVDWVNFVTAHRYSRESLFRAGTVSCGIQHPNSSTYWWGTYSATAGEMEIKDTRSGVASCYLEIGGKQFFLLSGSSSLKLTGGRSTLSKSTSGRGPDPGYLFSSASEPTRPQGSDLPADWRTPFYVGRYVAVTPNNASAFMSGYGIHTQVVGGVAAALAEGNTSTSSLVPSICNMEYDFTSRYIIDYDHRSDFCAYLKIRVACSGASWSQAAVGTPGYFIGMLVAGGTPRHQVEIFFETTWKGTTTSKLLTSAFDSRPLFECPATRLANPFVYPSALSQWDIVIYPPPELGVPAEAISQMKNLLRPQGLGTAYVGEDIGSPSSSVSDSGIEFSRLPDGPAPYKHASGMLYARTFKLYDFYDALWLLIATKCNATKNDAPQSVGATEWYYMSQLGDNLKNHTYHIEMRDGEFVDWTTELFPQSGIATPDVKLFRV
jgi:hypothetical protein